MLEIRKAQDRGIAELDWLSSRHTFSFAHYHDPEQMGFSDLLVINDDEVKGGGGFAPHPHRDMEIFTYVLSGALEHKDSMGNGSVIRPGDVQIMSAGSGVRHSEYNHSATESVHLLQIWILPNAQNIEPSYQQQHYSQEEKRGQLRLIISPNGSNGSLRIHQDSHVYAGCFDDSESATLSLSPQRYAYVHVARGTLELNGTQLQAGDGARIRNEHKLVFSQGKDAEVLVFDLRARD